MQHIEHPCHLLRIQKDPRNKSLQQLIELDQKDQFLDVERKRKNRRMPLNEFLDVGFASNEHTPRKRSLNC